MTDLDAMLHQFEGTGPMRDGFFFPYQDTQGIWSIGYGHNLEANGLSPETVRLEFERDKINALEAVRYNFSCYDQLSRPRQLVLLSMGFQFGKSGLAKWPRFISAVHLGKWDEAAKELLDSKAATQAPTRFKIMANMMKDNQSQWV